MIRALEHIAQARGFLMRLIVLAVLALPVALGTLIALGLADTWLNFRDRPRVPPVGG